MRFRMLLAKLGLKPKEFQVFSGASESPRVRPSNTSRHYSYSRYYVEPPTSETIMKTQHVLHVPARLPGTGTLYHLQCQWKRPGMIHQDTYPSGRLSTQLVRCLWSPKLLQLLRPFNHFGHHTTRVILAGNHATRDARCCNYQGAWRRTNLLQTPQQLTIAQPDRAGASFAPSCRHGQWAPRATRRWAAAVSWRGTARRCAAPTCAAAPVRGSRPKGHWPGPGAGAGPLKKRCPKPSSSQINQSFGKQKKTQTHKSYTSFTPNIPKTLPIGRL